MPAQSSSKWPTLIFLVFLLLGVGWFIGPRFLPLWSWWNINLKAISQRSNIPLAILEQEYDVVCYYKKRGENDPFPWVIVNSNPVYNVQDQDEEETLVRVRLLQAGNGEVPGTLLMGTTKNDRFYKAKVLRLPPGSAGFSGPRPIALILPMSWENLPKSEALVWADSVDRYPLDTDYYPEREDGWEPAQ